VIVGLAGSAPRTSALSRARFRTTHFRTAHRNCGSAPSIPHLRTAHRITFLFYDKFQENLAGVLCTTYFNLKRISTKRTGMKNRFIHSGSNICLAL